MFGFMRSFAFWSLCLGCLRLWAQLPSEVLLVVNGSSPAAMRVANHYIEARDIPASRVLVMNPPESFFRAAEGRTRWTVPETLAREQLLEPVAKALEALNDPFPTALLMSPDWPTRIRLEDGTSVSVTAYLGTLGNLPPSESIKYGQSRSPWFTLPEERAGGAVLHRYPAFALRDSGHHPAMMIGVFYEPLDADNLPELLKRAVGADHTSPEGTVAIVTNTDVRTTARLPQMEPAVERLRARGVPVHLATRAEPPPDRMIGVMKGAANVPVQRYRGRLAPGSFAEHLTSFAGTFHNDSQTKMTRWIEAGAAATAGTVDEPFAIWTKFPLVEIFERHMLGNTILESLSQSVGSPYQSLFLGDALSRPWGKTLEGITLETEWEERTLLVRAQGIRADPGVTLHLFVNGNPAKANGGVWRWEATPEDTGAELELLLHARKVWAPPETTVIRERVRTPFPEHLSLQAARRQPAGGVAFEARSERDLVQWELFQGNRRVYSGPTSGRRHRATVPLEVLGDGPATYSARGVTATGRVVTSSPTRIVR